MSQESSRTDPPKDSVSGDLDLRGLEPGEARTRAFSGMFRFKPGQRIGVLVDPGETEKEIMQWIGEIGHRFVRGSTVDQGGKTHRLIEVVKMEARR